MSKRILVVDDEDDIRDIVSMSLQMVAGWEVLTAASGDEGIAKAQAEQPDVILLDVMMPALDGPATLQRLRSNSATRHIPVILLTAKIQGMEMRRLETLGVTAILPKPFNAMTLPDDVAAAVGWKPRGLP